MADSVKLSTDDFPFRQRCGWLREVIGREYTNVEITPPPEGRLFNEMTIYPWDDLRLSSIRSNAITLERSPREPTQNSHDAYFAVVLLSGFYSLEQGGREVTLNPGDMTIDDATRPHRIVCEFQETDSFHSPAAPEKQAGGCRAPNGAAHSGRQRNWPGDRKFHPFLCQSGGRVSRA